MFANRPSGATPPKTGPAGFSILGADAMFTGNIAAADLHIEGRVEGDVVCTSLEQGTGSTIRGSVKAGTARIAGTIDGSVEADELIAAATARIAGDCSYRTLKVEPGASIAGRLIHNIDTQPALKVVAAAD